MLASTDDVLDRAKSRIGTLAERVNDPTLPASDADDVLLTGFLGDAITQIAKDTDRLETTVTPKTEAEAPSVPLPPHVDLIQEARVHDGKSFAMTLTAGEKVAQKAKAPGAKKGRPSTIGQHGGELWLFPVPDEAYELVLICTMNGAYQSGSSTDDTTPPTLDALVKQLPHELGRAVVSYVAAEWMADSGEPELAQAGRRRFERDVAKYSTAPRQQRTYEREYQPLGGITS